MKFDDLVKEEGGTIKLDSGKLMFNVTKQRTKDLKAISQEITKCELDIDNLNNEINNSHGNNSEKRKRLEMLEMRLKKLRKDKMKIAAGKKSEYITGGNYIDKNDLRVDNIHFDNGNPNDLKNWKERIDTEKELSNRLNNQNTKRKYRPR